MCVWGGQCYAKIDMSWADYYAKKISVFGLQAPLERGRGEEKKELWVCRVFSPMEWSALG